MAIAVVTIVEIVAIAVIVVTEAIDTLSTNLQTARTAPVTGRFFIARQTPTGIQRSLATISWCTMPASTNSPPTGSKPTAE